MITAGILSDTHLRVATGQFRDMAERAFAHCDIIFHAGDITSLDILELFRDRTVHGVSGNMCDHRTKTSLPESKRVELGGYTIGLCHGAGPRHSIEERVWTHFPDADCIIYGHTHEPVCRRQGGVLFINPGAFQCTSRHGAPASYAIMTIDEQGISAQLKSIYIR